MNFRRFLRHLFSFSQVSTIRRSGSHRNKSKIPNRVHLETLEDRFNPSQMFWPDLSASTGGMPFQVQTVDLNNDGKFDYVAATNGGITVGLGLGGGAFSAGSIISLGTTPKALAFGDFNGDSKLDIVTANEATDSVTLLLGNGSGGFQPGASFKVGSSPKAIAVGKFEGASDTTLDIVTANYGSDNLTILLGNGPGTFKAGIQVSTGGDSLPAGVAVGEFNGDANPDIVAINNGTSTALIFTGNGNGSFAKASAAVTLNGAPESVIVGDFNKNGKLDFATTSSNNNSVTVALGNGNGTFVAAPTLNLGSDKGPTGLVTGDFNGDNLPDLATANRFNNSIAVFAGNGDGKFKAAAFFPAGGGALSLAVEDFNGDTKADLLTANPIDNTLSLLGGNGSGGFADPLSIALGGPANAVVLGDLNGDGKADVAVGNTSGESVTVFWGNGDGSLAPGLVLKTGKAPESISLLDFNGDSKLDIVADTVDNVVVFLSQGNGAFATPLVLSAGSSPIGVFGNDFNADAKIDLVVANAGENTISLFAGKGDGTFVAPVKVAVGNAPDSITAGDFNGDGKVDLAVANFQDNTVSVLLGNGNTTFQGQKTYAVGVNPTSIGAGDFNGDGTLDLVTTDNGGNSLSVLFGNKDGTFQSAKTFGVGASPGTLVVRDFNGDNKVDLSFTETGSNAVSVLLSNGNGTFAGPFGYSVGAMPLGLAWGDLDGDNKVDLVSANSGTGNLSILLSKGDGSFKGATTVGVGLSPNGLARGDFNNDGKMDIATANFGDNKISVLLSAGQGKFLPVVHYDTGTGPISIVAVDLNNDGILDLVSANNSGNPDGSFDVSILLGNSNGSFKAATSAAVGANPVSVAFGDFNGDGKIDLLTANQGDGDVTLLLGNGDGKFQAGKSLLAGGAAPQAIIARDLNGDGKLDYTVSALGDNKLYSYLGNGNGSFLSGIGIEAGQAPFSIDTGDFNKDGKIDLVSASAAGNDVSLLLGNGDGKFKIAVSLFSGAGPYSVTTGDFDGDGNLDIAAANSGDNALAVLLGNGNGTFEPPVRNTVGSNPYGIVWGDFDGDKRIDLATANSNTNNVSVLYNFFDLKGGVVNTSTSATFVEGITGQFQIEGQGSPRPTFAITAGALPTGMKLDAATGLISGTPAVGTSDSSPYSFTVTATNSVGSGAKTFSFNVQKTSGIAPIITSANSTTFTYGSTGSFTITATGTPAPTFSVTSGTLPSGITLNSNTGLLSGKANAGVYNFTITASNNINPAATQAFTLTVNQAALTITAEDKTKVYGAALPGLTVKVDGLVNGDTTASISGLGASTKATASSPVGKYAITPAGTNPNYKITLVEGNLSVTKAALTISAEDKTKVYGADLPTLTTKIEGLVNGDTAASITGLTATTVATKASKVGDYAITPAGTNANYEIKLVNGTLTVTKAALTITAEDKTKVYGAALPTLTTKVEGLVNGDTTASITGLGATTSATKASKVGDYDITPAGANANYEIKLVDGTLTVTKAALTITAENKTKVYGAAVPALTTIVTGLVNGDTTASISGLGATTSATKTSKVGNYAITPAGTNANYEIKLVDGTLAVGKAKLTITPNNLEKTKGSTLTFAGTEFATSPFAVDGDKVSKVTLTSPGAASTAAVGKFDIVGSDPTGTGLENYDITLEKGVLTVVPINTAPSGGDKSVTFNEDTDYKIAVGDFGFSDPVDGDNLKTVKFTVLPTKGTLKLNGVALVKDQEVKAADIASGLLVFSPGANQNGAKFATVQFQVRDDGGTANGGVDLDPTANTLTINVTSVNDAPTGADKTITINEDTAYPLTVADFGFADASDSPANAFKAVIISALPNNGSLKLNGVTVTLNQGITTDLIAAGKLIFSPDKDEFGVGYGKIEFRLQDDGGTSNGGIDTDTSSNILTLNVNSVNDAPQGENKAITFTEKTITTPQSKWIFSLPDFPFTDVENNALASIKFTALPLATKGSIKLNNVALTLNQVVSASEIANGKLIFDPVINGSGNNFATVQFQIRDNGGTANGGFDLDSTPNTITFNLTPVNTPPVGSDRTITINEDSNHTFSLTDFSFTDRESNKLLSVRFTSAFTDVGTLKLNGVNVTSNQEVSSSDIAEGSLTFISTPNKFGSQSFKFQLIDNGGTKDGGNNTDIERTLRINVQSVNDAPSGTDKTIEFNEDTKYVFKTSDFNFTDVENNALASIRFTTLPLANKGSLKLNNISLTPNQEVKGAEISSGLLVFTPAPANANGINFTSIQFQIRDNGGTTNGGKDIDPTPATLTLNVNPVNDPPSGTDKSITVLEDRTHVLSLSDFIFTDIEGDQLASVKFAGSTTNGTLKLNGVALSANQEVKAADIKAGLLVYTPSQNNATDKGVFQFQVRDNGGTVNGGVDLDPSFNTLIFNITPVNDSPAGSDRTITINEDISVPLPLDIFGFSDSLDKPANAFKAIIISALPTNGSLKLNGATVTLNQSIATDLISAGKLVFTPSKNEFATPYSKFEFRVQDNGGTANGGSDTDPTGNTLTFNVNSVNDAPEGTDKSITFKQNNPYTFSLADFPFTDPENNALASIKFTVLPASTKGSLKLNNLGLTANQSVSAADIANGKLVFIPVSNGFGNNFATTQFQIRDNGGTANGGKDLDGTPNTLTFNITPINDPPSGTDKTITLNEDSFYGFTLADFPFTDPENNQLLSVKFIVLPSAEKGTITLNSEAITANQEVSRTDIATGKLRFVPVSNAFGINFATARFQLRDDGGTLDGGIDLDPTPNTLTFNVNSVNDAPTAISNTISLNEDSKYVFKVSDFLFTDIENNALATIKFTTLPLATKGSLKLNNLALAANQEVKAADINSGLLTFTPSPANANGFDFATAQFQVRDNGGIANGGKDLSPNATLNFLVRPVNDPPTGADKTVTILEDSAYKFSLTDFVFTDLENNQLASVKFTTLPLATKGSIKLNGVALALNQEVSAAQINEGILVFTPVANGSGNGLAGLQFQVRDNGGTGNGGVDLDPTPNTLTFNVTPVNDAPSGADKAITINEDISYPLTVTDFGFSDSSDNPANTLKSVIITGLPSKGSLKLNGEAVTIGQTITPNLINDKKLVFTPVLNDSGTGYGAIQFRVQDNGGTANGGVDTDPSLNTLTFNVNPVNDAPQGNNTTVTLAEDSKYIFTLGDFSYTDNELNLLSSVKITALPLATKGALKLNGLAVAINQVVTRGQIESNQFTFTPVANGFGNSFATLQFQVRDNGGTANGGIDLDPTPNILTINVTPVNDRPTLTTVNTLTGARRNTPFEITYAMLAAAANEADVDGDPISFKIQTVNSSTGKLEKLVGTQWLAITPGTTMISKGEVIRWTSSVTGSALNAFTILANDGLLDSLAPAVQVKITATT